MVSKDWKKNFIVIIKDVPGIALGSMFCGIGYSMFLIPFKAAPGGVGGLSQIFYYLFNISPGIGMFMFNIPLFIIGIIFLGRSFGIKTLLGMLFVSFFTDFLSYKNLSKIEWLNPFIYQISDKAFSFTNEYFLGVLAGSALLGIGIGIVFRYNGSTGGTDIPALIMKKYLGISPGNSFLLIDSVIILSVGLIFKNGNLILWGFVALFVSSKVCDYVIEGLPYNKGVFIISKKSEEIKNFILNDLDRGCTVFRGAGGFTDNPLDIIYVVINLKEIAQLTNKIKNIDNECFITVNEVHDVFGRGFKKFSS